MNSSAKHSFTALSIRPPRMEATDSGWYLTCAAALPLNPLRTDTRCECLVIGAGWMGMHAARRYAELRRDAKVILADAGRIGNNASGRCMGFAIDLAHNPRKRDFVEDVQGNRDELAANLDGNAYLRSAVEELGVDCDWDPQGKYHSAASGHGVADLLTFSRALERMGQKYRWVEKAEIQELTGSTHYIRALHHPGTILLQPAKYLKNMARALPENVSVHEKTCITRASYGKNGHVFETPKATIRAQKVIICAAGYLSGFGFYPGSAIPVYTFASMTRALSASESAQLGSEAYGLIPADSFGTTVRRTRDRRLFLRNLYRYAKDFNVRKEDIVKAAKQQQIAFARRWPQLSGIGFEASWGGLLTLSQNGGMVFGKLAENVYGAAFCNGTGISRGTAFGKAVAEMAAGRDSPVIHILQRKKAPNRAFPNPITHWGVNALTSWRFKQAGDEV